MVTEKCITEGCKGQGRFDAKDRAEAARLAKQRKLRAHCPLCDEWWTLSDEEQAAVESHLRD